MTGGPHAVDASPDSPRPAAAPPANRAPVVPASEPGPPSSPTPTAIAVDPYTPAQMAARVEAGGVAKASLPASKTLALGVLAGAFIGLGAQLSTIVATENGLGFGVARLLVGLSFSLGLVLVLVGGAELFTGNALIVIARAQGRVSTRAVLANWALVYLGNLVGALVTAIGMRWAGLDALDKGAVGRTAVAAAEAKVALGWLEAFVRGVFCNALVCLAVWLSFSARSTTDRILCIVGPVTAFVAMGLEHSIANLYSVPYAMLVRGDLSAPLTLEAFVLRNLLPVTLGNVVGGSLMVGLAYWFVYLRPPPRR